MDKHGDGRTGRSHDLNSESEPEVITKEELAELEELNKSVNEEIYKALEARDQFTWNCLGLDKSEKQTEEITASPMVDDVDEFEGGNWEYKEDGKSGSKGAGFAADQQKKGLRKMKPGANEELERRKKKALFGSRASSKIFDSANTNNNQNWASGENQITTDIETKE